MNDPESERPILKVLRWIADLGLVVNTLGIVAFILMLLYFFIFE